MKSLLSMTIAAIALIGCASEAQMKQWEQERVEKEAQRMAAMENQCSKYGFRRGTDQFAQCLLRLDQADKQREAAEDAAFAAAINKAFNPPKTRTTCIVSGDIIDCD